MSFGYDLMQRNQMRKRNFLRGRFFVNFRPAVWMDKDDRKDAIHRFKNPRNWTDEQIVDRMIDGAISNFRQVCNINQFDCVVSIPSRTDSTVKICRALVKRMFNPIPAYHGMIEKELCQNVLFDYEMMANEPCYETNRPFIEYRIESFKRTHFNEPVQVKFFGISIRRYAYNLLKIADPFKEIVASMIQGKRVLIVDDTYGEGITLKEASNLLARFNPLTITCFTVVKDFR